MAEVAHEDAPLNRTEQVRSLRGCVLVDRCRSRIGGAKVKEGVTPSSCLGFGADSRCLLGGNF